MTNKTTGESIPFDIILYSEDYKERVSKFDCGNEAINKYITKQAYDDINVVNYLVVNQNSKDVIGFISLCCSGLRHRVDKDLYISEPAMEFKYFAIQVEFHKMIFDETDEHFYFSDKVICEMIKKCYDISEQIIGSKYILLYSVETAVHFYERNMFKKFNDYMERDNTRYLEDCTPMFMVL